MTAPIAAIRTASLMMAGKLRRSAERFGVDDDVIWELLIVERTLANNSKLLSFCWTQCVSKPRGMISPHTQLL